jgi:hypothetical protein
LKFEPHNLHVEQFCKQPTRWKIKISRKTILRTNI